MMFAIPLRLFFVFRRSKELHKHIKAPLELLLAAIQPCLQEFSVCRSDTRVLPDILESPVNDLPEVRVRLNDCREIHLRRDFQLIELFDQDAMPFPGHLSHLLMNCFRSSSMSKN